MMLPAPLPSSGPPTHALHTFGRRVPASSITSAEGLSVPLPPPPRHPPTWQTGPYQQLVGVHERCGGAVVSEEGNGDIHGVGVVDGGVGRLFLQLLQGRQLLQLCLGRLLLQLLLIMNLPLVLLSGLCVRGIETTKAVARRRQRRASLLRSFRLMYEMLPLDAMQQLLHVMLLLLLQLLLLLLRLQRKM